MQCSNCATTWFQPGNRARVEEPEASPKAATDTAAASPPPRRDLDPALRDILREEREREEQLRRAVAPVEEQEEMALDSPAPAPVTRATEAAQEETPDHDEDAAAIRELVAEETARPARAPGARELFPDIEEINSTLRATTDRKSGDVSTSDVDSMDVRPRRRRGFRLGFMLIVLLAAAGIGAYAYAPLIRDQLPQAEPYLTQFVAQVDHLRFRLDDLVQSLASQLSNFTGN